jgi:hypothetical protein
VAKKLIPYVGKQISFSLALPDEGNPHQQRPLPKPQPKPSLKEIQTYLKQLGAPKSFIRNHLDRLRQLRIEK